MTEERIGPGSEGGAVSPWKKLVGAFRQAVDPKCLLLAAAGILLMAAGWWVLGSLFYGMRSQPDWSKYEPSDKTPKAQQEAWKEFQAARKAWNLLHELAGAAPARPEEAKKLDAADLADDLEEFDTLEAIAKAVKEGKGPEKRQEILAGKDDKKRQALGKYDRSLAQAGVKPFGLLVTWPWFEYRGPNPFLQVTGQIGGEDSRPTSLTQGSWLNWLFREQAPVLLEPLAKFLLPLRYILHPDADWYLHCYLALVILWTLAVWGFFGGAITRIVAVNVAKPSEKVSLREALRFVRTRCWSYFFAPLTPLLLLAFLGLGLMVPFGLCQFVPILGDVIAAGLLWWVVLLVGLIMACILVGLIGWPMMYPTISAEGSDAFDAFSRSYSYLYQAPLKYLWYSFLAVCYGAVLVFFIGFMGSLIVYLGKWSVAQMPYLASKEAGRDRNPTYYFVHAPTSFGWRDLALQGSPFAERTTFIDNRGVVRTTYRLSDDYMKEMSVPNHIGAIMVSVWLYLLFLVIVGFGYSFFFASGTIIYLLIRAAVDETELDEVYLEEIEDEDTYQVPTAAPAGAAAEGGSQFTMVEAPTLRTDVPATSPLPSNDSSPGQVSAEGETMPLKEGAGDGEKPSGGDGSSSSEKTD